jgi:molybdopterin synthase sulfur carrier subunit
MLNVLYFASIREALGRESETIELPASANVAGLVDALRARGDRYAEVLAANRRWRVAVNQEMVGLDASIKDGDEVAVFPPVTGG